MTFNTSNDQDAAAREFLEHELAKAVLDQFTETQSSPSVAQIIDVATNSVKNISPAADETLVKFKEEIAQIASTVLKIPAERLDVRENMSRYGVDSIVVTEIMRCISDHLDLPIAPTVFFEAGNFEELATILYQRYHKRIDERYQTQARAQERESAKVAPLHERGRAVQKNGELGVMEALGSDALAWIQRFRSVTSSEVARPQAQVRRVTKAARADGEILYEPIAIIAMDGVFPQSADLLEFERHLRQGDDCISEIPADRWDWREVYGDPKEGEFTRVKYGGFAPDIDKFDPLFFGMSPREAQLMDPQHRQFIQCVWRLIESAGYAPKALSGSKVGLFIGINLQDYAHLVDRADAMDALHLTSLGHMFCPNRLSFLLNLHGPSQVIDTACSSSSVALHRAVLSIQYEGCEMAIAGGANLLISPDMHIMYSKVGMICEDGRCKTFSKEANGYVRSDGIGAVLLKSLHRAEEDGDIILAVIRGSAENHGGMSTSLTAPNPKAQASLIVEAHRKAKVDPRSIGYIECHGTGTSLGDPIEINGLKLAFEQLYREAGHELPMRPSCGLGSVKSNIGHAETSAGIAGVIKTVLSLRNKRLYQSLHSADINPMIDLEQSPFFILQQGRDWQRPLIEGQEQPRRAGISSFGAGGSNAHIVIEEYLVPPLPEPVLQGPLIILLSAKNAARLDDMTRQLLHWLESTERVPSIVDIAYTLQVGREALSQRLALIVTDLVDLKTRLRSLLEGGEEPSGVYRGDTKANKAALQEIDDDDRSLEKLIAYFSQDDVHKLAKLWTQGVEVDWPSLYARMPFAGRSPRRVALPTYPFARQRHWIDKIAGSPQNRREAAATSPIVASRPAGYPLLQRTVADPAKRCYGCVLTGEEFFLTDHQVKGNKVLPGVAYLEMARAAVERISAHDARDKAPLYLKNVVWARPLMVNGATSLYISLAPEQDGRVAYRIYSEGEGESTEILHSQGSAILRGSESGSEVATARLDLDELRERITGGAPNAQRLESARCYEAFRAMGIDYGPAHRCLESVYFSAKEALPAPEVLAKLVLPAWAQEGAAAFVLHPGLIDSGLQACIGLIVGAGHELPTEAESEISGMTATLPFALDSLTLLAPPSDILWVWVRYADGSSTSDKVQKLDIDFCDVHGRVCIRLRGFSSRALEAEQAPDSATTVLCEPLWNERSVDSSAQVLWARHEVLLCDVQDDFDAVFEQNLGVTLGVPCSRLALDGPLENRYQKAALGVFEWIRQAIGDKIGGSLLLQIVIPATDRGCLLAGLSGLLKTANRENNRFRGQLIELELRETAEGVAAKLQADSRAAQDTHIRHRDSLREVRHWQVVPAGAVSTVLPWKDNGVYLITGGNGGLAWLFAEHIAQHAPHASLVMCGRSALTSERHQALEHLRGMGPRLDYRRVDVTQAAQVEALIRDLTTVYERIDGVLHCAGLLRDNFIQKKTPQEFAEVLAPKVAGTLHLDHATQALDLDFFILFSSAAGVWGSAGQTDYAAANGFLDAFASYRQALTAAGRRHGRTLSIDWPLWAEGGMRMEANAQIMMQRATGLTALPSAAGIEAFCRIMGSGATQMMVMHGAAVRIQRMLDESAEPLRAALPVRSATATEEPAARGRFDTQALKAGIEQLLLQRIAELMKFELEDLDVETQLTDYGFNSITLTDFSNRLNQQYSLEMTPTVFFEYPTVSEFAGWLSTEYPDVFAQALGLSIETPAEFRPEVRTDDGAREPSSVLSSVQAERMLGGIAMMASQAVSVDDAAVAIIGMSGRFPMAEDIQAFWSNLLEGKDCISEIPEDRWDWRAIYGDPTKEANKSDVKWGGFIDGVAHFDARFFGISPREAELMDPQQRLLMQYVWKAVEDAGYAPASLSGSRTAIFVGTASSGYGELMAQEGLAIESYSSTGVVGSVGPNRMSYFLNLHGPSEPVETACSSSLVAIHRALSAMAIGDCDQAIVGGVNLLISPQTHISFNKAGMLCSDGRCKTFSSKANGYVRGEGVGMLMLKKLKAAEQAGNHIYAVIRGSAENHGGRGSSLTAPNPKAQTQLIKAAYERAGIDPRSVSYIEAHGTGTELGDPIEINALKAAFKDLYQATGSVEVTAPHCALGAVKTNIGHLELAAGVAGVIKVLLQLKHKTLVKSLHCDEVNPYIQLQGSPFYLLSETQPWSTLRDAQGRELPRRAGISSFGFGGVNAHLVLEEYPQAEYIAESSMESLQASSTCVVPLSAKTPERLKVYASSLLDFITAPVAVSGPEGEGAHQLLTRWMQAMVAEILEIAVEEIELTQPLQEYGFDTVHGVILLARFRDAWGVDVGSAVLLGHQTSITSFVTTVLREQPSLRERLSGEPAAVAASPEPGHRVRRDIRLADLAYTLQVGRDAMAERLAMTADSMEELEHKLRAFVEGRSGEVKDLYQGSVKQNKRILSAFAGDEEMQEALDKWIQRGKLAKLLEIWVAGLNIDWQQLYGSDRSGTPPHRISAPGYPFAEQRHWIQTPSMSPAPVPVSAPVAAPEVLHPLVHESLCGPGLTRFKSRFEGTEFFLDDHRVKGRKVMPGVAYLEMAHAAAHLAQAIAPSSRVCLQDVAWISPLLVDQPQEVLIDIEPGQGERRSFSVYCMAGDGRRLHSQGGLLYVPQDSAQSRPCLELQALLAQSGMRLINADHCYERLAAGGLEYGPGHRGIHQLYAGNDQVLAHLVLPESLQATAGHYVLHPCLVDSALQASIGLVLTASETASGGREAPLMLPFAVQSVDVFASCESVTWAWLRHQAGIPVSGRVQKLDIDLCDERGKVCIQIKGFSSRVLAPEGGRSEAVTAHERREPLGVFAARATTPSPAPAPALSAVAEVDDDELSKRAIDYFKALLSSTLKFPVEEIAPDETMDAYGIDSIMVAELTSTLESHFGPLSKTLFFEYQTLGELVDYFLDAHRARLLQLCVTGGAGTSLAADAVLDSPPSTKPAVLVEHLPQPVPMAAASNTALDIAVIGISGRYPMANDLDEFWLNLREGKDCVSEVPSQRWNWRDHYSEEHSRAGGHFCKWGGFIDDIDKFDPLFFNISPSAAEYMDPQERLFLEHAWMAMEDAGYRREDLRKLARGSAAEDLPGQVGVYAGVMYSEYQLLGIEAARQGKGATVANFHASVANRVSYVLDLHGPSMTVDTMCSSSLTALHLACQDLKTGRTDMALAGGVNLSVHPNKYSVLSLNEFISSQGRCTSFGEGGDGYVPSEGVGVVLLKRLVDAERDRDHIHAVIKSSVLNHGGKTHGFSVPNPKAQQHLISRALREAEVDPRAITYVEAHGTGTPLGDPIEVTALSKAFAQYSLGGQPYWIGSVKSNIGHTESTAGIAGLSKVILQMREGQLAPSLHSQTLNPNIDFASSPFQVNRQLREWPRPVLDGRLQPRVASLSSFGAGGSNAHLVISEYIEPVERRAPDTTDSRPCLIVLSAKSEERLKAYAGKLCAFLESAGTRLELSLRNVAYTLQVGREAMQHRLAFSARSIEDARRILEAFAQGREVARLYRGYVKTARDSRSGRRDESVAEPIRGKDHDAVLALWVKGVDVNWQELYAAESDLPYRISLPTYPFARERYWLTLPEPPPPGGERRLPNAPIALAVLSDALLGSPAWKARAAEPAAVLGDYVERRLYVVGSSMEVPGIACVALDSDGQTVDQRITDYATQLFGDIKTLFQRKPKPKGEVLFQILLAQDTPMAGALAALLKTAAMENPQFFGQVLELGADILPDPSKLGALLDENAQDRRHPHIRYSRSGRQVPSWSVLSMASEGEAVWKQGGVYLVSGGVGGLGLIFAREIIRRVSDVTLILTGRSPLEGARAAAVQALRASGTNVEYRRVDVGDRHAVTDLIGEIERFCRDRGYGELNGVIHAAGVLRDNFILRKTHAQFSEVMAAKVAGVVNLDLATRSANLDFFVMFSSLAGVVGNPGQCDYSTANAFLDHYTVYRNQLVAKGGTSAPKGHTLSIDWPLWQEGGMDLAPEHKEELWRSAGIKPMRSEIGIAAFYACLQAGVEQALVLEGDLPRLRQLFFDDHSQPVVDEAAQGAETCTSEHSPDSLVRAVEGLLVRHLSELLKLPEHRIETDVPVEHYGIDSVGMMRLTVELEETFGSLSKTLFFEYQDVQSLAAYLAQTFPDQARALCGEPSAQAAPMEVPISSAPEPGSLPAGLVEAVVTAGEAAEWQMGERDIAIIGMSGRFPFAPDLEAFWENLSQGCDCITEIPPTRWKHQEYFDPEKGKPGKTYCKWGGFLESIDQFDPLFFKIPPAQAEVLDPQERLFLETVWNLLESSGYLGETLQRIAQSRVGVFVGSMSQQYHAFQADLTRESLVTMSSHSSIANRVSYFFDFQGPSVAVDTMCSSALVAVHMACESLLRDDCKAAVAGGVNLSIHPKKYIGLSASQILGSHPDSSSFGQGDGYLPSEGVGAVLLKPLREAVADNDTILGVIKSTTINHSGQSNGYFVPNGAAQTELMVSNFTKAGIDPRTLSYVESAANGSSLGDAIEINALTAGFGRYTADKQFCALGSVKSNIGHGEAASGIAQLIKVLLQLKHRQLVPTIKAQPLNSNIDFTHTPFCLQRRLEPWRRPSLALGDGPMREYPLRATVSSFGAGGSNAHLILEEFPLDRQESDNLEHERLPDSEEHLLVFSARTEAQLQAVVQQMLAELEKERSLSLADIAFTLQTGRKAMDFRLAVVVEGVEARLRAVESLRAYLRNETPGPTVFVDNVLEDHSRVREQLVGSAGQAILQRALMEPDLRALAGYWVKGIKLPWHQLHAGWKRKRVVLPTYPFERKSYWLGGNAGRVVLKASEHSERDAVEPEVERNGSASIERVIAQRLGSMLGMDEGEIEMGRSFQDYGVDSIASSELCRALEQTFKVQISSLELFSLSSLAELAELIAGRLPEQPLKKLKKLETPETVSVSSVSMPVSEGQKGLWLLHQRSPNMSAYNVPLVFCFKGELDVSLFRKACELMLERHPILGSVFRLTREDIQRIELREAHMGFEHVSVELHQRSEILERLRDYSKQPFDLEQGPLYRVYLLTSRTDNDAYVLICVHHIVFDGSSAMLLLKDLLATYRNLLHGGQPANIRPAAGYQSFVHWQRQLLNSEKGQTQLDYWKTQLSGEQPVLSLPYDFPRPAMPGFHGASEELTLSQALSSRLQALTKTLQVNPSVVFLGAFKLLLNRYSGYDDIRVGMPTSGRSLPAFQDQIGYFVNMLVIRSRVIGQQSVADFLKVLQLTVATALDNADCPFPVVLEALRGDGEPQSSSWFQVVFSYQNFIRDGDSAWLQADTQGTTAVELVSGINQEGGNDIALDVYHGGEQFLLKMAYDKDLFEAATIRRIMTHYVNLLESIATHPRGCIADQTLLSADERQKILGDWSNTGASLSMERQNIVQLFQRQVRSTPHKTALVFEQQSLTFAELDDQSSRLSLCLANYKVAPGDLVGACLGRGVRMVVALLAILKADAVYVPIAPDSPVQRICRLLVDSGISLLLSELELCNSFLSDLGTIECVCLAIDAPGWEPEEGELPVPPVIEGRQPAYVIYTSGSTGQPKGVIISHDSISHHCQVIRDYYRITAQDVILQFAPMNVDAALEQLLPGLISGATVVIRSEPLWSPDILCRKVVELGISVLDLPPSYLYELLLEIRDVAGWSRPPSLRLVISGGEALSPETLSLWCGCALSECRLVNAYGPTETTITSTVYEIESRARTFTRLPESVPIGRPLPGESAYILDTQRRPLPVGVPGELYIGGAGVAIGYLNRPELTASTFVENPFMAGTRLYKTGDAARWLADGNIALLGRLDQQVKIRGFRVECGEIEAALQALDVVKHVAVLAQPTQGSHRLVAFLELVQPALPEWKQHLKQALIKKLPEHMIPSVFVSLPRIPLSVSGKVDRNALKHLELANTESEVFVAPRTSMEIRLAEIWRRVLDIDRVGVHDSFFDLGGHSLLALRLMSAIKQGLGYELPISSLFQAPTLTAQAELLGQDAAVWSPLVCLQASGELSPWFCIHAAAGNVLCYRELAECLGIERPFYALQAPDAVGGGHPGSIVGLAALYVRAIRIFQPWGPYFLAGWSMGGVVAYEMAQQLLQAGEQVEVLALLESYTPEAIRSLERKALGLSAESDDRMDKLLRTFAVELGIGETPWELSAVDLAQGLEWILKRLEGSNLSTASFDLEQLHKLFRLYEANLNALDRYRLQPYSGRVVLIYADQTQQIDADEAQHLGGWQPWLRSGHCRSATIVGDHYSILQRPQVVQLAKVLTALVKDDGLATKYREVMVYS
uniref:Mixed type I polyketide synthase-peptide synthetase n=1 Tax=symbiont bacterium of Paederus fuscipes TaxID=176282 RepID=Q6VT93_UNCXX|nr:mixed type I polyketide synthase - peptide synthetase [symbiont bacterium of Paederus fuscipes]